MIRIPRLPHRNGRQTLTFDWVGRAFGAASQRRRARAERVLEEAIELAQSVGYPQSKIAGLAARIYAKEPGDPEQEVGGVSLALMAFCEAIKASADECEARELERVLDKPIEHFHARLQDKIAEGIVSTDLEEAA